MLLFIKQNQLGPYSPDFYNSRFNYSELSNLPDDCLDWVISSVKRVNHQAGYLIRRLTQELKIWCETTKRLPLPFIIHILNYMRYIFLYFY